MFTSGFWCYVCAFCYFVAVAVYGVLLELIVYFVVLFVDLLFVGCCLSLGGLD